MHKNPSAKIIKINRAKKLAEMREIKHGYVSSTGWHLTVEGAAFRMNCSTRRVRQLLAEGRLTGFKDGTSWRVKYPLMIQIGTRGPKAKAFIDAKRGFLNQAFL